MRRPPDDDVRQWRTTRTRVYVVLAYTRSSVVSKSVVREGNTPSFMRARALARVCVCAVDTGRPSPLPISPQRVYTRFMNICGCVGVCVCVDLRKPT